MIESDDSRRLKKVLNNNSTDLNARDEADNRTLLMKASFNGKIDCVKVLLEQGATVNKPYSDDDNSNGEYPESPLSLACGKGHEVVKVLLDYGAEVLAWGASPIE